MRFPRRLRRACRLALALLLAGCALAWSQTAPHPANNKIANAIRAKQIFSSACAQCHGLDGRGSERAPNIADRTAVQRLSDSQIFQIIRNGVPGTGMPAFHSFDSSQIRAVVAHLRTLQGKNKTAALPGNPEQGKALFFGKAGCSQCHMVAGDGGFIASDLSEYARIHEADQIRSAIIDPASTGQQGRLVTVTLHSGEKYAGRVRDEDNFSVQLQSLDGTFYFLSKSEIDNMQTDSQSLMPSDYGTRLSTHELNDVVSYLIRAAGDTDLAARKKSDEFEY
jgi:cytochrome c oxidase cbb3-type subunit III